jgi:hypothetical protein
LFATDQHKQQTNLDHHKYQTITYGWKIVSLFNLFLFSYIFLYFIYLEMGLPGSDDDSINSMRVETPASPNEDIENIGAVAWNAAIRSAQPPRPPPTASPNVDDDDENMGAIVAWNAAVSSAQPSHARAPASLDIDDDNMGAVGGGVIAVYGEHI